MTFVTKLDIVEHVQDGHSVHETALKFGICREKVQEILDSIARQLWIISSVQKRRNLTLGDKLIVLLYLNKEPSINAVMRKFNLSRSFVKRIKKNKQILREIALQGTR